MAGLLDLNNNLEVQDNATVGGTLGVQEQLLWQGYWI